MGKKLILAFAFAVLGAIVCPLPSQAQGGFLRGQGPAMRGRPHFPVRGFQRGVVLTGRRARRFPRRAGFFVYPYLYPPYYYSDYYGRRAAAEAPQERVVVVENPQPRAEAAPPSPPPESLMLELRGNHWVRVTGSGQTMAEPEPGEEAPAKTGRLRTTTQQSAALKPPRELPPAVLVFRDGHKEEITRYTIVGSTIYTSADYWNSGSWTRKVPIAELNVPATLELNRERGANFSLPSNPHVVVIRP